MCTVNHDLKAIYIHIPKTGGLYVEETLIKFYGFQRDYSIKPNNYGFEIDSCDPILPLHNRGALRYCINNSTMFPTYIWDTYYKFTFVRNPYTRLISAYEFLRKNSPTTNFPSLNELLRMQKHGFNCSLYENNRSLLPYHYYHLFITQTEHLKDNFDCVNVNFIGRNEYLNQDLIRVLKQIGVNDPYKHVDNIKRNVILNKTTKLTIDKYIDYDILHFINNYYEDDFKLFHYSVYTTLSGLFENISTYNEDKVKNQNLQILSSIPSEETRY